MTYKVQIDKFRDEGTKVLYKDGDSIPSGKKIGDWNESADPNIVTKKLVGFRILKTDTNDLFIIDKWLTKVLYVDGDTIPDGKKIGDLNEDWDKDKYCSEAYKLCETEITAWKEGLAEVGKTFNPDSGKIE